MPKAKKSKSVKFKSKARYVPIRDPYNMSLIQVYTLGGMWRPTPCNMPHEIKVYGQTYRIYYHTKIYSEPTKTQQLRGVVLYANRIIVLDPDQTLDDLREVLYHEVGHVYLKNWQTKSEPLFKLTYHQVEHICDLMGEAICDLARNNPPVAA